MRNLFHTKIFCKLLLLFSLLPSSAFVAAQENSGLQTQENGATAGAVDTTLQKKAREHKAWNKIRDYFVNGNKPSGKKFDLGVIPGPSYSSTKGLGIGIAATGLYSMDRADTTLQKSNVVLFGNACTKGFLLVGIRGANIFPGERFLLDYKFTASTLPTDYWGIGYAVNDADSNKIGYRYTKFDVMARFSVKIAPKTYLGPVVNYRYGRATDFAADKLYLFDNHPRFDENGVEQQGRVNLRPHTLTMGLSFTYDSRDFMLNAYKGWFFQLDQLYTPKMKGNTEGFHTTELTLSKYGRVWKGGVLAGELHADLNYGGRPTWNMLAEVGSGNRMRGYFEGRYRDNNLLEMQLELRQHIRKRHGVVFWVGAAEVFPRWKEIGWKQILPNYGLGYRFEFRQRVNIRFDFGFTKKAPGFMFNLNEAF